MSGGIKIAASTPATLRLPSPRGSLACCKRGRASCPALPLSQVRIFIMTSKKELSAIAKKQLALREQLWPAQSPYLWDRKTHDGFTTIPKTMPIILKIMDEMSKNHPLSNTYLTLWCSTWDNSFVTLSKPRELAHASGFGGQRGEQTWASRMKRLHNLHFINIKPGNAGPLSHAIIWNPHTVIRWHHDNKTAGLQEASYNALVEWALGIGAKDMAVLLPEQAVTAAPLAAE